MTKPPSKSKFTMSWQPKPPAKTKADLRDMLAEAVKNTANQQKQSNTKES